MNLNMGAEMWSQFGASLDMLKNAIEACPETVWDNKYQFWYRAYHTIFYLDYYLSEEPNEFAPPKPFTFSEFDPSGIMPERVYTKHELLSYLDYCRTKSIKLISSLNDETIQSRFINEYKNLSRFEILLYNMRHVHHHTGQLNMILGLSKENPPRWVTKADPTF